VVAAVDADEPASGGPTAVAGPGVDASLGGAGSKVDEERLRRTLGDPELSRVVARLARRIALGRSLDADVTLADATEGERLALRRLLGRPVSLRGRSLRIVPAQLAAALLRAGIAPDLRSAVEALAGPVTPRPEIADRERLVRSQLLADLAACRHATAPWYGVWATSLETDGTLTRLVRSGSSTLAGHAVAVLDQLPSDTLPLPVLAERATGNTKALAGTPLARLVLRALALREAAAGGEPAVSRDLSRADVQRLLWESAGAIPDDMASQVLVLGLTAEGPGALAGWLSEAAEGGIPFRVTLQQLVAMPLTPTAGRVLVCENPSVLRAAALSTGRSGSGVGPGHGTALICTEGNASAACHRLVGAITQAGIALSWRGDFDWTGMRAVGAAMARHGARPWRMGLADYEAALAGGETERLKGPAAASPWDPRLAARMAETGQAVMEERIISSLLSDLA
jgi:uncharacterized protein (TIGR02679 family)